MELKCPKCESNKIMRRKSVPRIETHGTRIVNGQIRDVKLFEPLFYVCYNCWHKFNIK